MIKRTNNAGFTIVELMIATVVFSVLLVVIAGAMIQIGRLYYKGVTAARTQEVARSVMTDITQALQFNNGTFNDGVTVTPSDDDASGGFCVGDRLYSYRYGQLVASGKHALVSRSVAGGCSDASLATSNLRDNNLDSVDRELLGADMRLAKIDVNQLSDGKSYEVTVRVVYGADDLMCDPDLNNCDPNVELNAQQISAARNLSCKSVRSGSQFCAVSELSTIVERRLQ